MAAIAAYVQYTPLFSLLSHPWSWMNHDPWAHCTKGYRVALCTESMYNILWSVGSNSETYFSFDMHICHEILKKTLLNGVTAHSVNGVAKLIIVDNFQIKGK